VYLYDIGCSYGYLTSHSISGKEYKDTGPTVYISHQAGYKVKVRISGRQWPLKAAYECIHQDSFDVFSLRICRRCAHEVPPYPSKPR
jgi:hypothetical protein